MEDAKQIHKTTIEEKPKVIERSKVEITADLRPKAKVAPKPDKPKGIPVKNVTRFIFKGELYRRDRLLRDGSLMAIRLQKVNGTYMPKEAKAFAPNTLVTEVK